MNCKSIKLALFGGLVGCVLSIGITVSVYETKMSTIEVKNQLEVSQLKEEKKSIERDADTYKYLYTSQENDIKEYRVQVNKTKAELSDLKNKIYLSKERELSVSRGDFKNKDLSDYAIMTVDELNKWIAERAPKGSPFIGKADIFLKASQQQQLDPKVLVASSGLESGWGLSDISKQKSNYFGITAYNDSPMDSATVFKPGLEAGIMGGAEWIKKTYYDQNQRNLYTMINGSKAYCQLKGGIPSQDWIDQIVSIIYNGKDNALE